MADTHSTAAVVYSDTVASCVRRPGTVTKKAAQKVFIGSMLPQKGNQDTEEPFAAFFCGFQLKTLANLFKEGTTLLTAPGGHHLCCNAIKGTASDAEEAHLHSIDGSAGDLKQRMTG